MKNIKMIMFALLVMISAANAPAEVSLNATPGLTEIDKLKALEQVVTWLNWPERSLPLGKEIAGFAFGEEASRSRDLKAEVLKVEVNVFPATNGNPASVPDITFTPHSNQAPFRLFDLHSTPGGRHSPASQAIYRDKIHGPVKTEIFGIDESNKSIILEPSIKSSDLGKFLLDKFSYRSGVHNLTPGTTFAMIGDLTSGQITNSCIYLPVPVGVSNENHGLTIIFEKDDNLISLLREKGWLHTTGRFTEANAPAWDEQKGINRSEFIGFILDWLNGPSRARNNTPLIAGSEQFSDCCMSFYHRHVIKLDNAPILDLLYKRSTAAATSSSSH